MRKKSKTSIKNFSLRIDEELLRKFEYIANYQDRSINSMLNNLIRKTVKAFEEKDGEIRLDELED